MTRCVITPQQVQGTTIRIDDPRHVHHLVNVLRLKAGDSLICCDGQGREYTGTILRNTPRVLTVQIEAQRTVMSAAPRLWLAQGLPKADRFEWIVQKATELGVERISPLLTARTVVRPSAEQGARKCLRWQRIAEAAATQCRHAEIPRIDPPQPFEAWLASVPEHWFLLVPTLETATTPLKSALEQKTQSGEIALIIGPEGDLTREEVDAARAKGASPVSLGPLTLRAETAAIATLAILHYALDWS